MGSPVLANLNSLLPFLRRQKFQTTFDRKGPPAPQTVEAMVKCSETDFINRSAYLPQRDKTIFPTGHKALADLRNNTLVVICPVNKGGSLVIQIGLPTFYR